MHTEVGSNADVHFANERLGEFRKKYHVDEFFTESISGSDGAAEVAAKALYELCLSDGRYNGCTISLKTAWSFLQKEARDGPKLLTDQGASLGELKRILVGPECTIESISGGVNRWFKF